MNLSRHNTGQVPLWSRLTYFYLSYCPLLNFVFRTFLCHLSTYWLEISYMDLSWHNTVYSCWLGLRATDDLLALKMNCCQRPKAEGNSSSEGPTDHLLPENPDNNCFVIPHFHELCFMMNGKAPDKMIHYTTQNVIHFFLPLMNHLSRQNTNAIEYKNHLFFLLQATHPVLSAKVSQNDAHFRHAHGLFSADLQTTVQSPRDTRSVYSMPSWQHFCVLILPTIKNYIYFLFRSASNPLLGVRNDRRHL